MSAIENYTLAFDEINSLMDTSFDNASELDSEKRARKIKNDVLEILVYAYYSGVKAASEMLKKDLNIDRDMMMEIIYLNIDGKDWEDRIEFYIFASGREGVKRLVQTEYHRIWNAGALDGATAYGKLTGKQVKKKWNTMLDDRVRDTHWYLEGNTVPVGGFFRTYDGDYGLYPGDFQHAENNVNCRCYITFSI